MNPALHERLHVRAAEHVPRSTHDGRRGQTKPPVIKQNRPFILQKKTQKFFFARYARGQTRPRSTHDHERSDTTSATRPCGRVGCFSWKPRRQRCKHTGDLAATVSLAVAQARRLPVRPVSRLGSVRVSSATPRRPPGLVAWVKVGLGCKLGSWRACLAAACTGTA